MLQLDDEHLHNLKRYGFTCTDKSICGKLFMQKYWTAMLNVVPITATPNRITFAGFSVIIFMVTVLAGYLFGIIPYLLNSNPTGASFTLPTSLAEVSTNADAVPGWVWVLCGLGTFAYQTLDALDGKQARRIAAGSPLGELVDHGCDAITIILLQMVITSAMCLPRLFRSTLITSVVSLGFFTSMWEQYCTGTFYLGYINGPTEGLLVTSGLVTLVGFIGGRQVITDPNHFPSFMSVRYNVPLPTMLCPESGVLNDYSSVRNAAASAAAMATGATPQCAIPITIEHWADAVSIVVLVSGFITITMNIVGVVTHPSALPFSQSIVRSLFPILEMYFVFWHFCTSKVGTEVVKQYYYLPELMLGIVFALAGSRITVCRLLRTRYPFSFPAYTLVSVFLHLMVIGQMTNTLPQCLTQPRTVAWCIGTCIVIGFTEYYWVCYMVCRRIARFLGVNVFSLTEAQMKNALKLKKAD